MRGDLSVHRGGGIDDECRGDLLARERGGTLSGADGLALRAHLADCASCRLSRQVFADLDDVSGVDLRDGVRIERMSTAARRWTHQRSRPASRLWKGRRRLRALGLAALLVFVGGTASATVWLWRHPQVLQKLSLLTSSPPSEVVAPTPKRNRIGEVAVASEDLAPSPPAVSPAVAVELPVVVTPARTRRSTRAARADGESMPARLLRQASNARRAGDAERASELYRKLQQDHPRSSEAVLSSVPLGGLLLDRKLPRAALAQFDAYLGASRGGGLIPEALYGRGRALATLGDRKEERQTWDRLLADFPDSAYGPLARRRLADLK